MHNTDVEAAGGCGEVEEYKSSSGITMAKKAAVKFKQMSIRLGSLKRPGLTGPDPLLADRTHSPAARALKGLKFISKANAATWTTVEDKFEEIASKSNGLLPCKRLSECIVLAFEGNDLKASKEFSDLLCKAVAKQRNLDPESGFISKPEFKKLWDLIVDPRFDSRLKTFFHIIDRDADGKITMEEVREMISWSASANKLRKIQEKADEYARLFMEALDRKHLGYILIEDLEMVMLQIGKSPSLDMGLPSGGAAQKTPAANEHTVMRWCQSFDYFVVDNWRRIWVMAVWIGAMAALFVYKYLEYMNKAAAFAVMGHCLCVAKGAAETLKLNMALILLPMCRNTITWLRNHTRLGAILPFDDGINFHQLIAGAIAIFTAVHTLAHLTCDFPRILHASKDKYEPLERFFKQQPKSYWQFVKGCETVTGIAMVVLMAIAFLLALPCFRRNSLKKLPEPLKKLTGYNAFWYSHHLYIVVYTLLLVHSFKLYLNHKWYKKTTWMYLAIPLLLYTGERLTRSFRSRIKTVEICDKPQMYPGDVLAVKMSKPEGFRYKSGQYIFLKCDALSPFEWHPFSITSAPSESYISVHIRMLGDWTNKLKDLLPEASTGKNESDENPKLQSYPKIKVDGPYSAPTQDYKDYEVVLLVGLGIGATPMISVAKDIITNVHEIEKEEEEEEEEEVGGGGRRIGGSKKDTNKFKTKKAYFYWVTREEGSFKWFNDVMNEVYRELTDHRGVIEMYNHCSSLYEKGDARCALILMLQSIQLAITGEDLISGSRVKTHFAKPVWPNVFQTLATNHPDSTIGVFYCGAPQLAKGLSRLAHEFSHKGSTKFEFHKENF